ncbi:AAA domain-containing protein [Dokdonia sp. Hel_I_63]|uniref:AAA domain-containing protein n=1 Tax=Dokdonia sp. Hel_I_63 TaxID=1249996 RepID=UPI00119AC3FC|nr:AAA domain-containing protein [Dokdonia sp. Hel_I_63]TVZ23769.1 AAA domain-containing protein [Dokdonia sp. Hel_I_63]
MNTVGEYQIIQHLKEFNISVNVWLAESNYGESYEILTIKNDPQKKTQIERILKSEIQGLVKKEIPGVQKIIESNVDKEQDIFFIVYENTNSTEINIEREIIHLKQLLIGLSELKKMNRDGFYIAPDTINISKTSAVLKYIGTREIFELFNILKTEYLAPEVIDGFRPKFQSDLFSVFLQFKEVASQSKNPNLLTAFAKALSKNRIERFSNYAEPISILDKIQTKTTTKKAIKVIVKQELRESFNPVLQEMNDHCYIKLDQELSAKEDQITGQFTTHSYSGRFFVNKQNYIFLLADSIGDPYEPIKRKGFLSEFGFSYEPLEYVDSYQFFSRHWDEVNQLAVLHKQKSESLKIWQALPKMEREYIEEKAFKAKYHKCNISKSNKTNTVFHLTNEFQNWEVIKELKRNEVKLSIDDSLIGTIHDYNQKSQTLIIKDANLTFDEIPENGTLFEDVRIETSQFKKQIEACDKFINRDIVNPILSSILASPHTTPIIGHVDIDYQDYENKIYNHYLKTDETQKEAVLEALHKKPAYLIQGPPGTGKTTVIVEIIQQLIRKNGNAKILVTSQSNLAVDNVLERLPEDILFMRLASTEDRISPSIKDHSFKTKLSTWIKDTKIKSEEYTQNNIEGKSTDKAILKFHKDFNILKQSKKNKFSDFQNILKIQNSFIKGEFENANTLEQVSRIFEKHISKKNMTSQNIQREWFAFLDNAGSIKNEHQIKSTINNGSSVEDLQTALLKSTNVIGATCIHIASGQYKDVDFKFDYVIMDESSKATPAENLVPINMGENIILIGDHKQLPPVITSEGAITDKIKIELEDNGLDMDKEYGESLFEKLILQFEQNPNLESHIKMLDIQYRMPRQLGNLISTHFYDKKLKNPSLDIIPDYDSIKKHILKFKKPTTLFKDVVTGGYVEAPTSVIMITTSKCETPFDNGNKIKRENISNKNAILKILNTLNKQHSSKKDLENPIDVGIIAGYSGQVELLSRSIDVKKYPNFNIKTNEEVDSLIDINTVDKFQGAERDIIIYDIVKSSQSSSSIGFLEDYRRINVAFSRAKKLLIVVGDSEYILKRASLQPGSSFKEFKLRTIIQDLAEQEVIFNNLQEALE